MTTPLARLDHRGDWAKAGLLAVVLSAVTVVIVLAFAWPTSSSAPRNLPVVVAPAAAAPQVSQRLAAAGASDLLSITPVADEAAARTALTDREALGAIVIGPQGPRVLKAGAASPMAAQLMDQLAATLATGQPPVTAEEVVAPPAGDPHGAAFAVAALPLTLAGLAVGAAFGLRVRRRAPRLVGVIGAAVLIGVLFTLVLDTWLGLLGRHFAAEAAVIALVVAAVATTVVGLIGLVGGGGIGIAAAAFVLLGVPLAGLAVPWQALPDFWGSLGRWLPAGAGGDLLRRVSFFPDASVGFPLLVLLGWLAVGIALTWARRERGVDAPAEVRAARESVGLPPAQLTH